jgi:membrane protease subunit (stomatin/prohibitin family)
MAILRFLRNQLIDIVEWNQPSESDVMAWRFPRNDNEIKNRARLIVREGQMAVFVNMGKLADMFGPGMYTLSTENLPILSALMGWKHGFESPFKCEVYFIATRRFLDLKWGTANPIIMRDREFGMVRVRAYGSYAMQITDSAAFLRQVLATDPSFQTYEIAGQLRNLIVSRLSNALASSNIPVLDLAANLTRLSEVGRDAVARDMAEMGISLPIFLVENISLPENVEKALDKRTSMGMIGDMGQYMRYQAAESMEVAAANPGGGAAGVGVGLGAGMAMAQQFVTAMGQPGAAPPPAPGMPPPVPTAAAWFAAIGGQAQGPLDEATLRAYAGTGGLTRETLVWRQGMAGWVAAGSVGELAGIFGSVPPPLPPPH